MSKMMLKTEGDTQVVVTRHFAAPPAAVYRAHTDPKLIQKWLLGPEGWTMPVCITETKPGGKFRYEWTNGKGGGFLHYWRIPGVGAFITGSFISNACICPIPLPTTMSKRRLSPTATER